MEISTGRDYLLGRADLEHLSPRTGVAAGPFRKPRASRMRPRDPRSSRPRLHTPSFLLLGTAATPPPSIPHTTIQPTPSPAGILSSSYHPPGQFSTLSMCI